MNNHNKAKEWLKKYLELYEQSIFEKNIYDNLICHPMQLGSKNIIDIHLKCTNDLKIIKSINES